MHRRGFIGLLAGVVAGGVNAALTTIAQAKVPARQQVWGRCLNVPVNLENAETLTFSIAKGPVRLLGLYDGGATLICAGDEPDSAALGRAEIKPGHYRTCEKEGVVRFAIPPVFAVTADAEGVGLRSRVQRTDEFAGMVWDCEPERSRVEALRKAGLIVNSW